MLTEESSLCHHQKLIFTEQFLITCYLLTKFAIINNKCNRMIKKFASPVQQR